MKTSENQRDEVVRVVVVGAGFAGLNAARQLASSDGVHVTIVDRTNHHLFQPLLYQVSMAELNPGDIAEPIRTFFRKRPNVDVLMAEVTRIALDEKCVHTSAGVQHYDYLVVASGSRHAYFGNDAWEQHAPGLKTLEQATEIRRRVLLAFERAECCTSADDRAGFLTFVIVGGGPTGVELAGAIGEMANKTLAREFKNIDPRAARIVLLEGGEKILAGFDDALIDRAVADIESLGVEVRVNCMVTDINEHGVHAGDAFIPARTVLWAAGVAPSVLGRQLGVECDRSGRVLVNNDLTIPGHSNVFVAGDLAHFEQDGEPLPGLAAVALQQGKFIGRLLKRELNGKRRRGFRYRDRGTMATIGHNKAIAQIHSLRFAGYAAWIAWVFVHIYYLSGFRNRFFVMLQWAWAYFTHRRNMRLILGRDWRFYARKNEEQR